MNYLTRLKKILKSFRPGFSEVTEIKLKGGLSFGIETKNEHEILRATTFFSKEPEMIAWIDKLHELNGNKPFVFYDIGANIGIYSLYTATIHKDATVYSFEPEATSFSSLCCNIFSNQLSNIIPFELAISNVDQFELLHVGIIKSGAGASAVGRDYGYIDRPSPFRQGVYCVSLDSLYDNPFFKRPNFIKIDVDGHEAKILEGAEKILRDSELKGLIMEFEYAKDEEMKAFISKMSTYGFSFVLMSDWIAPNLNGDTMNRNFLFEKK